MKTGYIIIGDVMNDNYERCGLNHLSSHILTYQPVRLKI